MLNTPVQMAPQGYPQMSPSVQNQTMVNGAPQQVMPDNTLYNEQAMAISFDIAAEYSALTKMNNLIADVAKELKAENDPVRKKLLEARIQTLNNMVIQREARINQMELALNNIKPYCN